MFGLWKQRNERWVKARLSLYIDERLSVGERAIVESHLKGCLACRDELASLRATVEALQQLPLVEPARSFAIPALKLSPRPVTFYRLRLATVVVSVLLVAVIAGDSLGMFFKPEATRPLMAPAPAAMPAPRSPAAAVAPAPTATPTPTPTTAPQPAMAAPETTAAVTPAATPAPAPQEFSSKAVGGAAAPGVVTTPAPGAGAFQMQQAPVPPPVILPVPAVPAPAGRDGAPGKAGISAVPAPTPIESQVEATKAATPAAPPPEATPTPQPSPVPFEQFKAEIAQPTPETPTPSQAPPRAPDYLWPVRQFEIAMVALILILISATTYFWLRGKKE